MEAPKHSAVYGVVSYAGVEKRTQSKWAMYRYRRFHNWV